jgi:hypothetical protein
MSAVAPSPRSEVRDREPVERARRGDPQVGDVRVEQSEVDVGVERADVARGKRLRLRVIAPAAEEVGAATALLERVAAHRLLRREPEADVEDGRRRREMAIRPASSQTEAGRIALKPCVAASCRPTTT